MPGSEKVEAGCQGGYKVLVVIGSPVRSEPIISITKQGRLIYWVEAVGQLPPIASLPLGKVLYDLRRLEATADGELEGERLDFKGSFSLPCSYPHGKRPGCV